MTTKKLKELCKKVRLIARYGEARLFWEKRDKWQREANDWRMTLIFERRQYSFDFWAGQGCDPGRVERDIEGTLECLLSDAASGDLDFEDFCREFGYDSDSRKAERTWKACQKTNQNMKRLLGDWYDTFLYADRN